MTLREKIIVETYTGVCMVTGEERNELYNYIAELMGRPVFTHELADRKVQEELKERSKPDFINLCSTNGWIYCSDRLPTKEECHQQDIYRFMVTDGFSTYIRTFDYKKGVFTQPMFSGTFNELIDSRVIAWQPLPEPAEVTVKPEWGKWEVISSNRSKKVH